MEEKHYKKFFDIFRSLHINIPLADALEQMPKYAKYLKDLLTKKRKWEEHETIMLTEESRAILRKKLPPKLKDPGSFSIPCMIGDTQFNNALCDLGASFVGCQNITAKNQSLREERSSTGAQHSSLLFKYQVGTSTPVSEQEPRHMGAPQYRLNCQEADI